MGEGSFGKAWLATDCRDGSLLCLKTFDVPTPGTKSREKSVNQDYRTTKMKSRAYDFKDSNALSNLSVPENKVKSF